MQRSGSRPRGTAPRASLAFDGLQVDGLGLAALVLFEVVADLLMLRERAQSGALDSSDVDERVSSAVVGRDETKALGVVEEFYGAGDRHNHFLTLWRTANRSSNARRSEEKEMRSRKAPVDRPLRLVARLHVGALMRDCKCWPSIDLRTVPRPCLALP